MTCSPTRSAVRSCSSSGQQRRQLRPQRTKNQPVRREEPPAAAAGDGADAAGDAGVVADVAAVEVVAAGRSSPDTENRQRTGGRACAPPSPRSPPTD